MKAMDLREFRDSGYLQEANRLFFHPFGLALTIVLPVDESDPTIPSLTVLDWRDDPEGGVFDVGGMSSEEREFARKAAAIEAERGTREPLRRAAIGSWIEPPRGGE